MTDIDNISTLNSTQKWDIDNYKITTSYVLDKYIYINIISVITFQNYEGYIGPNELQNNMTLKQFYIIITKTFARKQNYLIEWLIEHNFINISFHVIFDEFYNISQTIQLEEKLFSNDKTVISKLTEMEIEIITLKQIYELQNEEITTLKKQIYELQNEEIIIAYDTQTIGLSEPHKNFKIKVFDKEIDFTLFSKFQNICISSNFYTCFDKLKNLVKIIVHNDTINNIFYGFNSYMVFFPTVLELDIKYNNIIILSNTFISIPNLEKISYYDYGYNELLSFELIKNTRKIKHIIYSNCLNIIEFDKIKNYCCCNNIKLEIK